MFSFPIAFSALWGEEIILDPDFHLAQVLFSNVIGKN